MIEFKEENFFSAFPEMEKLFPEHYAEIGLCRSLTLYPNFDMDAYRSLQRAGRLVCLTAREGGNLVGYFVGILSKHRHYKHVAIANDDLYFIRKSHRGPRVGKRLIAAMEQAVKKRGMQMLMLRTKAALDNSRLLSSEGYERVEISYVKVL